MISLKFLSSWRWPEEAPRREAALVQRCRDIAEREQGHGGEAYAAIEAELAALCGGPAGPGMLARLADDIRAGRFDAHGPERARLEHLLWRLAILKLRENNPEFINMK